MEQFDANNPDKCKDNYLVIVVKTNGQSANLHVKAAYMAKHYDLAGLKATLKDACEGSPPGELNDSIELYVADKIELTDETGTKYKGGCRYINTSSGPRVVCG